MSKLVYNQVSKLLLAKCLGNVKTSNFFGALSFQTVHPISGPFTRKCFYCEKKEVTVSKDRSNQEVSTDVKTVIKETTKTASYTAVILIGLGVTGALFYAVFRELFSSKSPSGIYSLAFKRCIEDTKVQDALGMPIKGHGETTSRGRRRHVSHVFYEKDGVPHVRMVFYLKGARENASVHLEMKENPRGDFEYRYLFLQMEDYTRRVIILEDNRAVEESAKSFKTPLDDFNTPLNLNNL